MIWRISHRADPVGRELADRHYNRQSIGNPQFVAPGCCVVLTAERALWITRWQRPEFCHHAWAGAWECSTFRNESDERASRMIRQAVAATRAIMGEPPEIGMITFVRPEKVRPKKDPGHVFIMAGFRPCGVTGKGYLAFRLEPAKMPNPEPPIGLLL